MTSSRLKILYLEDNPLDVDLAVVALKQAGLDCYFHNVDSQQDFLDTLDESFDIILADYTLPQYNALEALSDLHKKELDIPVIIITGTISEEAAVDCIKQGAADYILKDRMTRLGPAVNQALDEKRLRLAKAQAELDLRASEERYRFLTEFSPDAIILYFGDEISYVNQAGLKLLGASSLEDVVGKVPGDFVSVGEEELLRSRESQLYQGDEVESAVFNIIRLDGKKITIEVKTAPIDLKDDRGQQAFLTVFRDISDRIQREKELEAIAKVSEALRMADDLTQMVPVTLEQVMILLDAVGAGIVLFDMSSLDYMFVAGNGVWASMENHILSSKIGAVVQVFQSGQTYINNTVQENLKDPLLFHEELLKDVEAIAIIPLIAQNETIGVIGIGKNAEVTDDEIRLLKAMGDIVGNALQRAFLEEDLEANFVETVLALANMLEVRHTQTADHSQNMALRSQETLRILGGSIEDLRIVRLAALLHDIGKIGMPDDVLLKAGPLSDEEWEIVKKHPEIGAEIVAPIQKLTDVAPIIRAHHEKFDGTGYPFGLKGDEIPLAARVLTVIDAYGAMVEERVYRPARSSKKAITELKACAGADFDPQVVEAFIKVLREMREV